MEDEPCPDRRRSGAASRAGPVFSKGLRRLGFVLAVTMCCLVLAHTPAQAQHDGSGFAMVGLTQTDAQTYYGVAAGVDDAENLYLGVAAATRSYGLAGDVRWTTATGGSGTAFAFDPSTGRSARAWLRDDAEGNVVGTDVQLLDRDGRQLWVQPATGPLSGPVLAFDGGTLVVAGDRFDIMQANIEPGPGRSGLRRQPLPEQEILGLDAASGALQWAHFLPGRDVATLDVMAPGRYLIGSGASDDSAQPVVQTATAERGFLRTLELSVRGTIPATARTDDGRWAVAVNVDPGAGVVGHLVEVTPDARSELRTRAIPNEPVLANLGTAAEYGESLRRLNDIAVLGDQVYLAGYTRGTPIRNAFVLRLSLTDPLAPGDGVFLQNGSAKIEASSLVVSRGTVLVAGTTDADVHTGAPLGSDGLRAWYARLADIVDVDAPIVTAQPDRAPQASGWYQGSVTVRWAVHDADRSVEPPPEVVVDTEGVTAVTSQLVCDAAGNCAQGTHVVAIDHSAPQIVSATFDGTAGADGWHRSSGTLTLSCVDVVSGVRTCPSATVEGDGLHTIISRALDWAGNEATRADHIAIDSTPPEVTIHGPSAATSGITSAITGTASDATSGVQRVVVAWRHALTGSSTTVTATKTCDDRACSWTADVPAGMPPGLYEVTAAAADAAGWTTDATTTVLVGAL